MRPPADSVYGRAQRLEPPVSEYGAHDASEDFAEACRLFVMEKAALRKSHPLKYAALEELLR